MFRIITFFKYGFILSFIFLQGCATPPSEIPTAHVSPAQYSHYDCEQIAMEMKFVGRRANDLYYDLKGEADADATQMGVGLLLFWPTLFFLEGGDDVRAGEYARLKGEKIALEDASTMKKCDTAMMPKFEDLEELDRLEKMKVQEANKPPL
jgi:hypothetical protein